MAQQLHMPMQAGHKAPLLGRLHPTSIVLNMAPGASLCLEVEWWCCWWCLLRFLQAVLNIISNPVNSTVPIAAEALKRMGVYDKRKLLGVTTLDVVRRVVRVALLPLGRGAPAC
jgi:hypothetical protein